MNLRSFVKLLHNMIYISPGIIGDLRSVVGLLLKMICIPWHLRLHQFQEASIGNGTRRLNFTIVMLT